MLATLRTAAVFGVEACPVHVEVDVSFGFPKFTVVGLPDTAVRESGERVRVAIRNSGFEYPPHRITVNLSPADVRKVGASFDLPIALGILAASGVVERRHIADVVLLGELSLDGSIHPVRGTLPIAAGARRDSARGILLPAANACEAAIVSGLDVLPVSSLAGGGSQPRPGEVSLAHHGVLFLDEMLEFGRHVLEVLRQPLEEGCVVVARAARTVVFPARFMLVGAMNPCPCGFAGDPMRACLCTPVQIARYRSRLSGPLRDRL